VDVAGGSWGATGGPWGATGGPWGADRGPWGATDGPGGAFASQWRLEEPPFSQLKHDNVEVFDWRQQREEQ
jgi:hypothetical protein